MNLAPGITYSTKEMQEFFGVSKDTWKKQKNKLLENFGYYYTYKVEYSGRNINYHILEQLGDYQPPLRKGAKRDETYENGIIQVIKEDNIQTAANVARRLSKEDAAVKAFNHTSGTMYEYTRVRMRNMFGTRVNEGGSKGMITEKVWCRADIDNNCYIPLSQEMIEKFYELLDRSYDVRKQDEAEICNDYLCGLITRDEMYERIGERTIEAFKGARDCFKEKYGFYPIKVSVYELSAWENN